MNRQEIYRKAMQTWGEDAQIKVAIEEMSELTKALCKSFRSDDPAVTENVVEEIADVEIMMAQMRVIFEDHASQTVNAIKRAKIARLMERLGPIDDPRPEVRIGPQYFNPAFWMQVDDGYHAICHRNDCPNNIGSLCGTANAEIPKHLCHPYDGWNNWKCLCV